MTVMRRDLGLAAILVEPRVGFEAFNAPGDRYLSLPTGFPFERVLKGAIRDRSRVVVRQDIGIENPIANSMQEKTREALGLTGLSKCPGGGTLLGITCE